MGPNLILLFHFEQSPGDSNLGYRGRNDTLIPSFSPNPEFIEGSREKEPFFPSPLGRGFEGT
jgi:hypothetical protein